MHLKLNIREDRVFFQIVIVSGFFISLVLLFSALFGSSGIDDLSSAHQKASSTRTALALTAGALMGPFPTATGPTSTVSITPSLTPTATLTPTRSSTPTPFRYFIDTKSPRTRAPDSAAPAAGSTSASPLQPTSAPVNPPPTNPPPAQPTSEPATQQPVCKNPQGHPIPCH